MRRTHVRSHDDGIDAWSMTSATPHAALARAVAGYTDYHERTTSFTARRELASTQGVLIINMGATLEIVGADGATIRLGPGEGFAGGLAEGTSISRSFGAQQGVQIDAPVETIGAILGAPPAEIANRTTRLDAALGAAARDLSGRLLDARDQEARFALLDGFIADRLEKSRLAGDARLAAARRRLRRRPDAPIAEVAEAVNMDRRDLARRFQALLGVSPRRYARLARFEDVVSAIRAAPDTPLAELAAAGGYFDQPHFNREVRAFSGMTPLELRARLIAGNGGVVHE